MSGGASVKTWRMAIRTAAMVLALAMSLVALAGCEDEAKPAAPGSAPGQITTKTPDGLQQTTIAPTDASRGDIQTLRDQAVQDRRTLDDANRAVGVLGH